MVDTNRFIDKATKEFEYVAKDDQDLFNFIHRLSSPRKTGLYNAHFFMLQHLANTYKAEAEVIARVNLALAQYWLDSWDHDQALAVLTENEESIRTVGNQAELKSVLRFLQKQQAISTSVSLSSFPRAVVHFSNLRETIRRHLIGELKVAQIIRPSTKVFTKGSCFAENILIMLSSILANAPEQVKEAEERTTFDFAYSLISYEEGRSDPFWDHFREAENPVFIYTLGVSEGFFDDDGRYVGNSVFRGNIAKAKDFHFRSFGIEENAAQLEDGIRRLQKLNSSCKIIVTLSPVPLEASFRPQSSSFVSDCINKSIGRATVDVVMGRGVEGLFYFPSFEMVRWVAPYYGRSPFGADDGHPRHVNSALVKLICLTFLEYFASPEVFEHAARLVGPPDDLI